MVGCRLLVSATEPLAEFLNDDQSTTFVDYTSPTLATEMLIAMDAYTNKTMKTNEEIRNSRSHLQNEINYKSCVTKHFQFAKQIESAKNKKS
tara:strand:+ start:75 stop:350 length:276 start_codon:yes stop_codon:yes gene_type:complete